MHDDHVEITKAISLYHIVMGRINEPVNDTLFDRNTSVIQKSTDNSG